MRRGDVDAVLQLERAVYLFPWSARIFHDCLRVGYHAWVVTDDAGRVLGYSFLSIVLQEAHILNICVAESERGRGLADQLLDIMIEAATAARVESLMLEVRPSNRAARRLYKRRGFTFLGRRPRYYPASEGREDALLLCLSLVDA
ncbi:ribosomal protein S18-alanine N-acetyltransferase [Salinisphaera sp. USBA-960]|uniref:ribosomal protein S18-alanine N-acetyltransferase n=1 Tax=Salinisphaera orenii TaxID=856731 RepID=UPI000DBE7CF1|nr:ribosomal protein S18-alanine N-acetyltransferase [Salifodinibacter halophilus]NNC25474.1 ribosomal protein S18-alanine N-acetyltransferase [Salifodinibacter halophilus]